MSITEESKRTREQFKLFKKTIRYEGKDAVITVKVRFDDQCGNGHNSFSITGDITTPSSRNSGVSGCIHDEIAKHFPYLAPFIKWHLCSTDGPMHYVANTIYHASDRDCFGLQKDESRQIKNGKTKLPAWQLVSIDAEGNEVPIYKLPKYIDAEVAPPCEFRLEWRPWCRVGEGKERNLDAARHCAIWPEATDEDLLSPDLKTKLEARLPQLLAEFREAMEFLGFTW